MQIIIINIKQSYEQSWNLHASRVPLASSDGSIINNNILLLLVFSGGEVNVFFANSSIRGYPRRTFFQKGGKRWGMFIYIETLEK